MATAGTDTDASGGSTIRRWVVFTLGMSVLSLGTLLLMGLWAALGDPSSAQFGATVIVMLVVGRLFAHKMGVAR